MITDRSRTGFYTALLCGTVGIFGYLGYVLTRELLSPAGTYNVIDHTVAKLESDTETCQTLGGPPFKVYGVGETRRRPLTNQTILEDGRRQLDAVFWIEGSLKKSKVTVSIVEDENDGWFERYLATEVPGEKPRVLIQPVIEKRSKQSWSPFSRWF